ncbi:hypothetical protein [Hyphomicrobium sp. ghe19]|uniref:hypothetical protein n=1 Tax=Hyphomicrobium sp. ghe19 TaxID=2682968 RepID=UPI0030CAC2E4
MADIADALSGFSGSLGGLAKVRAAADKERADAAAVEFNARPLDQRTQMIASGIGPDGNPLPDHPAVSKVYGADVGTQTSLRINGEIDGGKFDYLGPKPVDQYIWEEAQPDLEAIGDDKLKRAGFLGELKKYTEGQIKKQAEVREADRVNRSKDAFFLSIGQTVKEAEEQGVKDTEGLYQRIQKTRGALQDGPLKLNIPKQEFDNQVLAYADKIADSEDPEFAKLAVRLISDPRDGIGPIGFKQENLNKSLDIAKRAKTAIDKAEVKTVTEKYATAALVAGLGGANLGGIVDHEEKHSDGSTFTVKAEDVRKSVFNKWQLNSAEVANRLKENPEQTMKREVSELKSMGLVNESWKGMFKSFADGLTEQDIQNPQKLQELQKVASLYDTMKSQSTFFLERHLDDNSKKLMDRYWVARNRLGVQAQDVALTMAVHSLDPTSEQAEGSASRAVKDKVEKEYDNGSQYASLLKETATGYVRMGGVSAEKAVELAAERLKSQGANVNGSFVPIPVDKNGNQIAVPEDFADLAELTVQRWADEHAPPGIKSSDLTLRGYSNGTFEIVDKRNGIPVIGINIGDASSAKPVLTSQDFIDTEKIEQAKKLKGDVREQNINALIRQNDYSGAMKMIDEGNSKPPKRTVASKGGARASDVSTVEIGPFINMLTRRAFWMSGGNHNQILPPELSRSNSDGTLKEPKK